MVAQPTHTRAGYTLVELLVVVAVIIIIGGLISSTLDGQSGNSKVKAAADDVTGEIAMARSHAMEEGRNYRLSMSSDGTKIRVSLDDPAAQESSGDEAQQKQYGSEKQLPTDVTLALTNSGAEAAPADAEGWIRLATFQQDGTCKEDLVDFEIREPGVTPLAVQIRGLTGHVTVNPVAAPKQ